MLRNLAQEALDSVPAYFGFQSTTRAIWAAIYWIELTVLLAVASILATFTINKATGLLHRVLMWMQEDGSYKHVNILSLWLAGIHLLWAGITSQLPPTA